MTLKSSTRDISWMAWKTGEGSPVSLGQFFFSWWGTENSQMVPNQENLEGDQPVQSQSRTAAIATTDWCAGALSWWNRTPFVSFPGHFEMSHSTTFQSSYLHVVYKSSVGLSGRKQCS